MIRHIEFFAYAYFQARIKNGEDEEEEEEEEGEEEPNCLLK